MVGTILQPNPCSISAEAGLSNQTCDPSPIVNRFFSGGAGSNRGFGSRQLSPLLPLANQPLTPTTAAGSIASGIGVPAQSMGNVVPIGGNGLLDASFEVRWTFARDWVVAFFVDAGFVSYGGFSLNDLSTTQVAVGIGFRYRTSRCAPRWATPTTRTALPSAPSTTAPITPARPGAAAPFTSRWGSPSDVTQSPKKPKPPRLPPTVARY